MARQWLTASSSRPGRSLAVVRIVVALVLSVHSIYRIVQGDVPGFGEFLNSTGLPLGVPLAWFITLSTLISSALLVVDKLVIPASICHIAVLLAGVFLSHLHHGWFVVGGGNDGMEYSVVLITCLAAVLGSYWPEKKAV